MALTVNNFTGFETQGPEEAGATAGSLSFPAGRSGAVGLSLGTSAVNNYSLPWVSLGITDAGTTHIFGFAFKRGATGNDIDSVCTIEDDSASIICEVRINQNGTLELWDANASTLDTSVYTVEINETVFIEVYADLNSASGAWEWFVNEQPEGSGTGADFTDGNAFGSSISVLRFYGDTHDGVWDDVYILSGATAASDRLGPVEVYMKQGAQRGVTPDTSALADTDLDEGTWQLASETPLIEQAQNTAASYTGGAAAGVVYAYGTGDKLGPNNDDRFIGATGFPVIKGVWRMARSGGGATAQFGEIGNDGGAASDIESSADLDITTAYANYEFLTETAATLPSLTEHAAIGFSKDGGGQDLDVAEMWIMLGVTVPALNITTLSDSNLSWPKTPTHIGPFEA